VEHSYLRPTWNLVYSLPPYLAPMAPTQDKPARISKLETVSVYAHMLPGRSTILFDYR
jgi:hypothetical protein